LTRLKLPSHTSSRTRWLILLFVSLPCSWPLAAEQFPLGILGATGRVVADSAEIEVVGVIDKSPASRAGLTIGDRISGIANVPFPPHSNRIDDGGNGPQRVLGEALDDIAARPDETARRIVLNVIRNQGEPAATIDITCQLPYRAGVLQDDGRQQLMDRAAEHLRATCRADGYWNSPVGLTGDRVLTAWATVALKSLGQAEDAERLDRCCAWLRGPQGRSWVPQDPLQKGPDNLGNWALTASVVALVECCAGQAEPDNKKTVQIACDALQQRMNDQGRFGHDVTPGYSGKGFNVINTLSHLAWAMGTKAGVPMDEPTWNLSLEQIRQSVDPNGGVRYWTMKNTGTADASLRTSSIALALAITNREQELVETFSKYLDENAARTREAHAVGSMGMILAPAALQRHDPAAYQRFLEEWRWYLSLMQDHQGKIHYIGGKRNNGGDSYLGLDRMACVIAIMLLSPPDERLILFKN